MNVNDGKPLTLATTGVENIAFLKESLKMSTDLELMNFQFSTDKTKITGTIQNIGDVITFTQPMNVTLFLVNLIPVNPNPDSKAKLKYLDCVMRISLAVKDQTTTWTFADSFTNLADDSFLKKIKFDKPDEYKGDYYSPVLCIATTDFTVDASDVISPAKPIKITGQKGINFFGIINMVTTRILTLNKAYTNVVSTKDFDNGIMAVGGPIFITRDNIAQNNLIQLTYQGVKKGHTYTIAGYEAEWNLVVGSALLNKAPATNPNIVFERLEGFGNGGVLQKKTSLNNGINTAQGILLRKIDYVHEDDTTDNMYELASNKVNNNLSIGTPNLPPIKDLLSNLFQINIQEDELNGSFLQKLTFDSLSVVKKANGDFPFIGGGCSMAFGEIEADALLVLQRIAGSIENSKLFGWMFSTIIGKVGAEVQINYNDIYPGLSDHIPAVLKGDLGGQIIAWKKVDAAMTIGKPAAAGAKFGLEDLEAEVAAIVEGNFTLNLNVKKKT